MFKEWLLILGVFAIAAALWYPIIYPTAVVQSIVNDMRGSTVHIWDEHQKAPLKYTIPNIKKIEMPPEVK